MALKDMTSALWCAVFALLLVVVTAVSTPLFAQVSDAFAPFVYDPDRPTVLRLDGEIDIRTPLRLGNALNRYGEIDTLELASPGGSAYGALLMVDKIHAAGLKTVIPAGQICYSSCSLLFFAGTQRAAEGELGVHQPTGADLSTGFVAMNDVLDVFERFNVPAEVRRRMLDTPPAGMYVFSGADLDRLGLVGPASVVAKAEDVPDVPPPEAAEPPEPPEQPAEPEAVVLTVKPTGGDYRTIASAIAAAQEGARIEVYPGSYTGRSEVTKSVDIVGVGPRDKIVWQDSVDDVVTWRAATGALIGLTIRQTRDTRVENLEAIVIHSGAPVIRDCVLSSAQDTAVLVTGDQSRPMIEGSVIRGSRKHGIHLADGASGIISDNDILGNSGAGIMIASGADPEIRDNRISDGGSNGIRVHKGGLGEIEGNSISRNRSPGIVVEAGATPVVRGNRIFDGQSNGILVRDKGRGTFEKNEIYGNKTSGVTITSGSAPVLKGNRIRDNGFAGVFIYLHGMGTIENNEIYENAGSGIVITSWADPKVKGNQVHANREVGLLIKDDGRGTIDGNEIFGNTLAGILIKSRADPVVRNNTIRGGKAAGIRVTENGVGTIEENEIVANAGPGISIDVAGDTLVRKNRIHGQVEGIVVIRDSSSRLVENEIYDCTRGIVLLSNAGPPLEDNDIHDCEPDPEAE